MCAQFDEKETRPRDDISIDLLSPEARVAYVRGNSGDPAHHLCSSVPARAHLLAMSGSLTEQKRDVAQVNAAGEQEKDIVRTWTMSAGGQSIMSVSRNESDLPGCDEPLATKSTWRCGDGGNSRCWRWARS